MNKIIIREDEELEKVPVQPGDMVFIKYNKAHKPIIKIFPAVIRA